MRKTIIKLFRMAIEVHEIITRMDASASEETSIIEDAKYLTIERAAIYTGLTERTIRDLVSQREITFCRPSPNRTFIPKSSLDNFMSRNPVYSKDERIAYVCARERKKKR